MMKIPFNQPLVTGRELSYLEKVLENRKLSGDGEFTRKCHSWIQTKLGCSKPFLTTSGSSALEMASILADIKPGDEIIMPSFTFVTTANAFVLRGANIVFVDIHPQTMNVDESLVERAITQKTKAIIVVHYAGVACEMDKLVKIARKYGILLIEDAAQAMLAKYKDRYLGTIGDLGIFSFHETKNYTSGEGGAILVNNQNLHERAEFIWDKGTNRNQFFRGEVDKYTWVDVGSSYLPGELIAAYLYAQMEVAHEIYKERILLWDKYYESMHNGSCELPHVPNYCSHNGHIFYIKLKDIDQRGRLINYLNGKGIQTVFHFIPLHSSPFGQMNCRFFGEDKFTTSESERLLRLPLWYGLKDEQLNLVVNEITNFFSN